MRQQLHMNRLLLNKKIPIVHKVWFWMWAGWWIKTGFLISNLVKLFNKLSSFIQVFCFQELFSDRTQTSKVFLWWQVANYGKEIDFQTCRSSQRFTLNISKKCKKTKTAIFIFLKNRFKRFKQVTGCMNCFPERRS